MSIDRHEIISESIKATPPVTVVGIHTIFGLELNEWVAVFTIVYIVLQIFFLLNKHLGKKELPIKLEPDE